MCASAARSSESGKVGLSPLTVLSERRLRLCLRTGSLSQLKFTTWSHSDIFWASPPRRNGCSGPPLVESTLPDMEERMRSLLRTTALASVLAFVAPYAAAEDVKPQADYGAGAQTETQTQTFESSPAVSGSTSVEQAGDAAGSNVELMAAFEQLRMLDEIGEVTVVKLQPGQTPQSADLESDKMTGVQTSDTADAAAEMESDAADSDSAKITGAETGEEVDERIASGFEASGTEPAQAGAEGELTTGEQTATAEAEVDSDTAPMTSVDTSADVAAET